MKGEANKIIYAKEEEGFSLFEVLIALAIMSVVSLALFQSTTQLLSVSEKSVSVTGNTLDDFVLNETFQSLVVGIVPAWPEDEENIFRGDEAGFSGLVAGSTLLQQGGVKPFSANVSVQNALGNQSFIDFQFDGAPLISQPVEGVSYEFSYLGWDQKWYNFWPPEEIPSTGFEGDNLFLEMPQLPEAIRLMSLNEDASFFLLASRNETAYPAGRLEIIRE